MDSKIKIRDQEIIKFQKMFDNYEENIQNIRREYDLKLNQRDNQIKNYTKEIDNLNKHAKSSASNEGVVQSSGSDKRQEELQAVIIKMGNQMDKIKEDNQRLSRDLELKDQDVVQSAGNEKKTEELQGAIMKMEKQMDKM